MDQDKESRSLLIALIFVVLFAAWFFSIKDVFNPFILSIIIIGFLLPYRGHKSVRVAIALVFTLFMVWLFYYLQDIVSPFLISFALAYLFDPVVDVLERRKVSRSVSIFIIIFVILGVLALIGLWVIPRFMLDIQNLAQTFPTYESLRERMRLDFLSAFSALGIDVDKIFQLIERESSKKMEDFIREFTTGVQGMSSTLGSVATQLLNLVLIPFITFYFLRDYDRLIQKMRDRTPARHGALVEKLYSRVNSVLSVYIRGKILVALLMIVITWIALAILGVQFGIVIGIMTGFLSLIPYVGPAVTFVIGFALGLLNPDQGVSVLKILSVLAVVQLLDLVVISPKVIGDKLGLHPVLLIFSLFVFAKILGLLGLLIAIPATAILKIFIMEWYTEHFQLKEFLGSEEPGT